MKAYLFRRLLQIIPTLLGITFITFLIIQLAPGNPATLKLQMAAQGELGERGISEQIIEQTKQLYGLDKPVPVQYLLWVKRVFTFDFGTSYKDHRNVWDKIAERLPVTLQLNLISIFLVYLIAIPCGVYSATRPESVPDRLITLFFFFLYSLPSFWVAVLLIMLFGGGDFWDLFPVYGISSVGAENLPFWRWVADRAWHLILPVVCLTYGGWPIFPASPGRTCSKSYARITFARPVPRDSASGSSYSNMRSETPCFPSSPCWLSCFLPCSGAV